MNLQFNFRKVLIIIFIGALPLLSLNMKQAPGDTPIFLQPFTATASFIHYTFSTFSDGVRNTARLYLNLWDTNIKYEDIKKKYELLKSQQILLNELKSENYRLQQLLDFKSKESMKLLASNVAGQDLIDNRHTLIINRGTTHGVKAGQAVISPNGAVGYILQAYPLTSQILILTDKYSVIDALVSSTRSQAIVEGTNQDFCYLIYLDNIKDIAIGDSVVASGLDNIFPKGTPIGTITKIVSQKYSASQIIEIKPHINIRQLEEVFVVLN